MKGFVICCVLLATVQFARSEVIGSCPTENYDPDTLLPDDVDCSIFYKCDWGTPVYQDCPAGLNFNTLSDQCDYPENVDCSRIPTDPEPPIDPEDPVDDFVPQPLIDCPNPDGKYATYIPDKEDCSKFYICEYGNPVVFTCDDGLLYDGIRWTCDYPEYVTCGEYLPLGDDGIPDSGDEDGSVVVPPPDGGDDTGSSPQPLFDCPAEDGKYPIYMPDKVDCTKYYVCVYGGHVEYSCPEGLHYDGLHWACNYPEYVTCGEYAPLGDDGIPGSDGEGEVVVPPGDDGTTPWVGECPEEYTDQLVLLASRDDPHKFYSCVGNIPVELDCPAGLVFNPYLQVCDYQR